MICKRFIPHSLFEILAKVKLFCRNVIILRLGLVILSWWSVHVAWFIQGHRESDNKFMIGEMLQFCWLLLFTSTCLQRPSEFKALRHCWNNSQSLTLHGFLTVWHFSSWNHLSLKWWSSAHFSVSIFLTSYHHEQRWWDSLLSRAQLINRGE